MATTGDVKIGRSDRVHERLKQLQTGCPHKLRLILHGPSLGRRERELHHLLRRYKTRQKGEWFAEPCLGTLPFEIYEMFTQEALEQTDWWKGESVQPVATSAAAIPARYVSD